VVEVAAPGGLAAPGEPAGEVPGGDALRDTRATIISPLCQHRVTSSRSAPEPCLVANLP
jgi:hypothetical protein